MNTATAGLGDLTSLFGAVMASPFGNFANLLTTETLLGGAGNDVIITGLGTDKIVTGAGDNTVTYHLGDGTATIDMANATSNIVKVITASPSALNFQLTNANVAATLVNATTLEVQIVKGGLRYGDLIFKNFDTSVTGHDKLKLFGAGGTSLTFNIGALAANTGLVSGTNSSTGHGVDTAAALQNALQGSALSLVKAGAAQGSPDALHLLAGQIVTDFSKVISGV